MSNNEKVLFDFLFYLFLHDAICKKSMSFYGGYVKNLNPDAKANTKAIRLQYEFGNEESSLSKFIVIFYAFPIYSTTELEAHAFNTGKSFLCKCNGPLFPSDVSSRLRC